MRRFAGFIAPAMSNGLVPIFSTKHRMVADAIPARQPLHLNDNFLSGASAGFIESLLEQYREDPSSVDESWHSILQDAEALPQEEPVLQEPMHVVSEKEAIAVMNHGIEQSIDHCRRVQSFIQAYEANGHIFANLDPVGTEEAIANRIPLRKITTTVSLEPTKFGLTEEDQNKKFAMGFHDGIGGLFDAATPPMTLAEIQRRLQRAYTTTIGWEFTHVYDRSVQHWIREHIETPERVSDNPVSRNLSSDDHQNIMTDLAHAVLFEDLLKKKHPSLKRFGLDGGESMVVGLRALIDRSIKHGVKECVVGMAHRGRLNTLVNVCGKPHAALFKEFTGLKADDLSAVEGQGDVKYHLGMSSDVAFPSGNCRMNLMYNPSHLEAVNPVTQGFAKAAQVIRNDAHGQLVLPIEIHGDASYAGQGVVYETMGLSELGGYSTKGTIHIVVNNQIGYTTNPNESRSSPHCADIARVFQCPVFHVNGDRPEDVFRVFQMAADFRRDFGKSVAIDFVCYRRLGHNESDDPTMTQPLVYKKIHAMPNVLDIHSERVVEKGYMEKAKIDEIVSTTKKELLTEYEAAAKYDYKSFLAKPQREVWNSCNATKETATVEATGISEALYDSTVKGLTALPKDFTLHSTVQKILADRVTALETGAVDYPMGEALAFGSLLSEGVPCRLSGQDVQRGTFSQRHFVYHDQKTGETFTPLDRLEGRKAPVALLNSNLSEYGVVGYELGYSAHHPNNLVVWEAQFGDFANGAQIAFDQFVHAGRSKWGVQYHPVISLPHGYEGQGPEHSSARLERYLQATSEDDTVGNLSEATRHYLCNQSIAVPTTPSQIFHLYRRQVKRNFRRPLFVFCSKARLKASKNNDESPLSTKDDFIAGSFRPVIDDSNTNLVAADKVRKVVLMSGAIYFTLDAQRLKNKVTDIALVRVEELAPFPREAVETILNKYKNAQVVWAQDEPQNMGAFDYVEPRLQNIVNHERNIQYVGRRISASPATGYMGVHQGEVADIIERVFA